ncbi:MULTISPECIES: DUF554 domain-containing protein [Bacillaceae]|uniref:DUF554 domain-containing protein n=1 Tax=Bacillaceae TaxID=186817 RepID=UPI001E2B9D86|nr:MULTISPECIES: DUF554 domain-containing protein [Bacillaceae]MCE4047534.1 DUF554 domain-containing protein [Bacillus sp. Au-Bac7]MCM3030808.1 DUF554 domain-containing protein [Niallia sp. MER 6]MDL0436141.1 DUF554 domain-containing protein [Niallia sp. SS-2023]UPO86121.1 DUF554 domain-containing protein [Niallia sp. Man26]
MILLGAIVNGVGIMIGALLGSVLRRIPNNMKDAVMNIMGLSIVVLGIQMALKTANFTIVILSLSLGAIIGELLAIEDKISKLGQWIEAKVGSDKQGSISQGFVTGTLIFAIGAMGIIGALDSGIRGNHDVLFTKSIIDSFIALILTSTLGIGVLFSAVPVIIYEGLIAVFATQIDRVIPQQLMDQFILEMSATGGVMIMTIGLNLIGLTKFKVANLLPGILVVLLLVSIMYGYNIYF